MSSSSTEDKRFNIELSRRKFLQGTVASAGLAAAASVAGCQPDVAQEAPAVQEIAGTCVPSFLTAPDPIPADQITATQESEIVVVGAGIAGLCAALAAAEAGAQVKVIEKRETYTARGMHIAGVNTRVQKELGIEIDTEQAVREIIRWSGNRVKEELHWLFLQNNAEAMDWMTDMVEAAGLTVRLWGANYKGPDYFEYPVTHIVVGTEDRPGMMEGVASVLEANAKEKGVEFFYNTPAARIVRGDDGHVMGMVAQNADGAYVQFNASKAVILATGDYGADHEMVNHYCPLALMADADVFTPPGNNTGDGHKMGLWAGAAMQKSEPHAPMIHTQAGAWGYCFLHVNKFGRRYHNEDVTAQANCTAKMMQPDNIGWAVYDDKFLDVLPGTLERGGGMFWDQVSRFHDEPFNVESEKRMLQRHIESGMVQTADTLEELAEKMGVPVDTFLATVARYNELAAGGEDLDFHKRSELLFTIDKPPYYAGLMRAGLLVIVGGLAVNNKMQVLDPESNPIPGLYAVGNVAGDFFGGDYPTIFPGHSHGRAITFGRLGGIIAAAEPA